MIGWHIRQRKEALRIKQKEAEELREMLTWGFIIFVIWGGIAGIVYWWFFS